MNQNRCEHRFTRDILENVLESKLKWHIMAAVSSNSQLFSKYFSLLLDQKMIRQRGKFYSITPKGREHLELLRKIDI